jgi:4-diphosphocytidyl-2-C-methyl-D-erythritol kinase
VTEAGGTGQAFELEAFAPAKVNLGLRVSGLRDDGYHELDSVFAPLDFGDTLRLEVEPARAARVTIRVIGDADAVPAGPDNLAARAAQRYLEVTGLRWQVAITLTKQIPVGAGLGGGSSDAAAVLRELAPRGPALAPGRLAALALELGADVPFFLDPRPARVRGIGERIEPLPGVPALTLLLVHPGVPLATAEVYRSFDALVPTPRRLSPAAGPWPPDRAGLALRLRNDLEPAARRLAPALGRLRRQLEALGAEAVSMSGSGAALYGVFPDIGSASTAQAQGNFPWSRVASTRESR